MPLLLIVDRLACGSGVARWLEGYGDDAICVLESIVGETKGEDAAGVAEAEDGRRGDSGRLNAALSFTARIVLERDCPVGDWRDGYEEQSMREADGE